MGQSLSPVGNGIINRVIFQKFFTVALATATNSGGWASDFEVDIPLKGVHCKYNGSAINTNTGPCLYVEFESTVASGGLAPQFAAGVLELFFVDT